MHVVVKLKTGEEVFGKMMIKNENSIEIDDAMRMRYHISDETDAPVMYFTKYCIFTQSFDVTIPNECIMHIFKDPVETLIDFYEKELNECKMSYKQNPEPEPPRRRKGPRKNETLIAMMEKLKGDHEVH
jgi:hypothetical protein